MENPRADKVAVVQEVRGRLDGSGASVVTEYRGLSVAAMAELRRNLTAAGGDYKVFKNTLVRRAVAGSAHEPLEPLLTGPTAIAFVHGDVSAVARALRDFSRSNPALVVKGGLFEGSLLSTADLVALADLPSRDVLLARVAGGIAAPLRQLGGLLEALPRSLAYGISALIDQRRAGGEEAAPPTADGPTGDVPAQAQAASDEEAAAPAPTEAAADEATSVPGSEAPAEGAGAG
jgi:large subunit ribosomal protein L10